MKKLVSMFLVTMVLFTLTVPTAFAVETPGKVICTRVSVRVEPDTNSKRLTSLTTGTEVNIIGQKGEWYQISLEELGYEVGAKGWVLKKYFSRSVTNVTLIKTTNIWADPWGTGHAIGEKDKGTSFMVISESAEYYCVQLNTGTAGVGFIWKMDLIEGNTTYPTQGGLTIVNPITSTKAVVVCNTLAVRPVANDDAEPIGFLHNSDVVMKVGVGDGYFQAIEYYYCGQTVVGYVHSEHLMDIYK